jgi:drug/metabolite transporter (DMT)-like permease
MPKPRNERPVAILCIVAAMCCYAVIPIFLRHFTKYLDPWTVNGVRYSVSALFWLPYVAVYTQRRRRLAAPARPAGRSIWLAALPPAAVNLVGQVGWGLCPYYPGNDPATIAFTIRLSFLFTMLFGFAVIPAERPLMKKPLFLCGAAVCMAGLFLMFAQKLAVGGLGSLRGTVILVATTVFWGAYSVSIRRCVSGYPIRAAFGVVGLYTAITLAILMLILGEPGRLADLPAGTWALLILSAFIGIAFGHVLYYRAINHLGPIISSGVLLAAPFLTFLGGWIMLGERMSGLRLVGGVTIVAGGVCLLKAKAQVDSGRRK